MSIARIGGNDLFYEEKGSGPAVILVPPAGATATTWGDVRDEIAAQARVITYDRRGYRRSPGPVVKKVPAHADDLIGLIEMIDAGPATLAGISVGATIIVDVLVRRPDLVRSAVLYEPPFHGKKHPDAATLGMLLRVQTLGAFGKKRRAAEAFLRWAYTYASGGSAWDRFPEAWRAAALDHAPSVLADLGMSTAEYIKPTALAHIQTPVICAHGASGRAGIAKLTRLLSEKMPSSRLIEIPGASHAVHFDTPKEFARVALDAVRA